jgi:hypothetical protein
VVVFALLLTLVNVVFLLGATGLIPAETGRTLSVAATVLAYPILPLSVLSLVGGPWLRDLRLWLLLLAPGVLAAYASVSLGLSAGDLFEVIPLSYYLASCLGLAAAVSTVAFLRTSIVRREGLLSLAATVAMIAAGPVYAYELGTLGLQTLLDANLGAPLAVLPLVYGLIVGNPKRVELPPLVRSLSRRRFRLPSGGLTLLVERRPKYAYVAASEAFHWGIPTLVVTPDPGGRLARLVTGAPRAAIGTGEEEIPPDNLAAIGNTVADFLQRSRGGTVLLDGLDYVLTQSPREGVLELIARLHSVARRTQGTVLVPLCRLTEEEMETFQSLGLPLHVLPNVEDEVEAILVETVGDAGRHILNGFCSRLGIRAADLSVEDLPALAESVKHSMSDFAAGPVEDNIRSGWESQAEILKARLLAYRDANLHELADAPWRRLVPEEDGEEDLTRRVREIFARYMGDAGTRLFESQMRQLKRSPGLEREDLPILARKTEAALAAMQDAIDMEIARRDLESRARRIGTEILRMAEVSG